MREKVYSLMFEGVYFSELQESFKAELANIIKRHTGMNAQEWAAAVDGDNSVAGALKEHLKAKRGALGRKVKLLLPNLAISAEQAESKLDWTQGPQATDLLQILQDRTDIPAASMPLLSWVVAHVSKQRNNFIFNLVVTS